MTIALVTGANRGIGLEVVRQLAAQGMTVILAARDLTKAQEAANSLTDAGLTVGRRPCRMTGRPAASSAMVSLWRGKREY